MSLGFTSSLRLKRRPFPSRLIELEMRMHFDLNICRESFFSLSVVMIDVRKEHISPDVNIKIFVPRGSTSFNNYMGLGT